MAPVIKSAIYALLAPFIRRKIDNRSIYLTFDDGPHPDNTSKILKILKKYDTKATFFMLGHEMKKYPDLVRSVISQGHTLGYHSYRHYSLKKISFREIREDVLQMQKLSITFNYPIVFYRPPYGDLTLIAIIWYFFHGKKIIMWSLDSRDSFEELSQVKKNISPEKVSSGEIILLHEDYQYVSELIQTTLKKYSDSNIECSRL